MPSGLIVMAEVRLEFNVYEQKENCPNFGPMCSISKRLAMDKGARRRAYPRGRAEENLAQT